DDFAGLDGGSGSAGFPEGDDDAGLLGDEPLLGGAAAPAVTEDSAQDMMAGSDDGQNKLAAWRTRFREECEEKDAEEKSAKAERVAEADAALKHWLEQHQGAVEARKASNRADESQANEDMLAALAGDSWTRVVTLVDTSNCDAGGKDITRMKDVLLRAKDSSSKAGAGEAAE
ncbi:unnamed protein product, partial [Symbiodinium sp. KB8]